MKFSIRELTGPHRLSRIRRDPKGLYAKAKAGKIKNFTGFDAPYEAPTDPEIHLHTVGQEPAQLAERVVKMLSEMGIVA